MTCNAPVEGSGAFSLESSTVDWSPNSLTNCFLRTKWAKLIWYSVSCSPEVIIFPSASVYLMCPSESQVVEWSIRWLCLITTSSTEITSGATFLFLAWLLDPCCLCIGVYTASAVKSFLTFATSFGCPLNISLHGTSKLPWRLALLIVQWMVLCKNREQAAEIFLGT